MANTTAAPALALAATVIRRVIMPSAPPSPPLILAKSRARRFTDDPQGTPTARLAELARSLLMEGGWWTVREIARGIRQQGFNVGENDRSSSFRRLCDALSVMERMDLVRCMKMRRRATNDISDRLVRHFMWLGGSSTPGQPCTTADLAEAVTDARRRALEAEGIIAGLFMGTRSAESGAGSTASSSSSGPDREDVPGHGPRASKRARAEAGTDVCGEPFHLPTLDNTMPDEVFSALLGPTDMFGDSE